ncbi:MAG: EVE domain-containing protein [Oceanobacter sp.]
MNYWLFKSEPDAFSIDDLAARPNQTEHWDGVRNYQARNFMRDDMEVGDRIFFYHSSCKEVGIAGLAEVAREAYPDHTQFDPNSKYHDPKASEDNLRWFMVDVRFVEKFDRVLTLKAIKDMPDITELGLVKKGSRLSIMPVTKAEFELLLERARG